MAKFIQLTSFWLLTLTFLQGMPVRARALTAERLRCEYLANPIGMDETRPRLSWMVTSDQRGQKQIAYHILVAGDPEALNQHRGDLWDSGKVVGSQTVNIVYDGKPLGSRQRCYLEGQSVGQGRQSLGVERARTLVHGSAHERGVERAVYQLSGHHTGVQGYKIPVSAPVPASIGRSLPPGNPFAGPRSTPRRSAFTSCT